MDEKRDVMVDDSLESLSVTRAASDLREAVPPKNRGRRATQNSKSLQLPFSRSAQGQKRYPNPKVAPCALSGVSVATRE